MRRSPRGSSTPAPTSHFSRPGVGASTASAGSSRAEVLEAYPAKLCRALAKAIVARGRRAAPGPHGGGRAARAARGEAPRSDPHH
eukprot:4175069-Alexandrium_andersonii.AAC.1